MTKRLTQRQLEMLRDYEDGNEATDIADFDMRGGGTLAWRNRERVIDALHKRGLVDADGITTAGRTVFAVAIAEGRIKRYPVRAKAVQVMKVLCNDGPRKGEWHNVPDDAKVGHAMRIDPPWPVSMSQGHLRGAATVYILRKDGEGFYLAVQS